MVNPRDITLVAVNAAIVAIFGTTIWLTGVIPAGHSGRVATLVTEQIYSVSDEHRSKFGATAVPPWAHYALNATKLSDEMIAEFKKEARGRVRRYARSTSVMFESEDDAVNWYLKYS